MEHSQTVGLGNKQEQVTWTHHLIFLELCMPEKPPEFNCNPEVETDLPPQ
jgi:hypothetical protein